MDTIHLTCNAGSSNIAFKMKLLQSLKERTTKFTRRCFLYHRIFSSFPVVIILRIDKAMTKASHGQDKAKTWLRGG